MNKMIVEYTRDDITATYSVKKKFDIKEIKTTEGNIYLKLGTMPFLNKKHEYSIRLFLDNAVIKVPKVLYNRNRWYGMPKEDMDLYYVEER